MEQINGSLKNARSDGGILPGGSTSTVVLAPRKTKGGTSQDASEHLASSDTEVGNIHFFGARGRMYHWPQIITVTSMLTLVITTTMSPKKHKVESTQSTSCCVYMVHDKTQRIWWSHEFI